MKHLIQLVIDQPTRVFVRADDNGNVRFSTDVCPPGPVGRANLRMLKLLAPELCRLDVRAFDPLTPITDVSFANLTDALGLLENNRCLDDDYRAQEEEADRLNAWVEFLKDEANWRFGNEERTFNSLADFREFTIERDVAIENYCRWEADGTIAIDIDTIAIKISQYERQVFAFDLITQKIDHRIRATMVNVGWTDGIVNEKDGPWLSDLNWLDVVTNFGMASWMRRVLIERGYTPPAVRCPWLTEVGNEFRSWQSSIRFARSDDPENYHAYSVRIDLPEKPWERYSTDTPAVTVTFNIDTNRLKVTDIELVDPHHLNIKLTPYRIEAWKHFCYEMTHAWLIESKIDNAAKHGRAITLPLGD